MSNKLTREEVLFQQYSILKEEYTTLQQAYQQDSNQFRDKIKEKDALLKEAIGLLMFWRDKYDGDGSFDAIIDDFLDKVTGMEAGSDGK